MQGRVSHVTDVKKDIHNTILGAVGMSGIGMRDFRIKLCP